MRRLLLFLLISLGFIFATFADIVESNNNEIEMVGLLDKSEAYYWAALDNGGYKRLLVESRNNLNKAKELFEKNKEKLSDSSIAQISLQINSLSADLHAQESVYGKKFSARYQLTKFLGEPLILTGGVINNHFFFYSPITTTIGKGIKTIIELITLTAGEISESQFDVVILATKEHQSRVGWLAHNFDNTNGVFYTLTTRYINDILAQNASAESTRLFLEGFLTDEAISVLSSKLSERNLLVISFDQMPANPGDEFFNINGDVYSNSDGSKLHSVTTMAFGFANASTLIDATLINLLMFVCSIIAPLLIYKYWNYNKTLNVKTVLLTSFYGFIMGRFSSWIAMPALAAYNPPTDKASYDSLPMLLYSIPSYLWLIAISITLFVVPILIPRLISHPFLTKYAHLPSVSGKGAFFGLGAAHGIIAYIALPLLINNTLNDLIILIPVYLSVLLGSYILGRSILDEKDEFSEIYSIPIVLGFIVVSFPLFGNQLELASLASLVVIGISMLIIIKLGQKENKNIAGNIVENDIEIDTKSSGDIVKLTEKPIYKKFSNYLTILSEAESKLVDSDCNYIAISGPPGSGKTEILRNLISDVNKNTDGPVLYFQGECKKNDGAELATPYDVFHQALGSTLTLDLFDQRKQEDSINSVINSAGTLLLGPIGAVLSTTTTDDTPSFSDDDIYAFIQEKLVELSNKSVVIFHLDDIQWIDEKSEVLLAKLLDYFNNNETKVLFLLGFRNEGNSESILQRINIDKSLINTLSQLNTEEQIELLTEGVLLSKETATWISSWLSQRDEGMVYPADLIDAVDHLARNGYLIDTRDGFSLSKDFDRANPPIPDGVKEAVGEIIKNNPEMNNIISITAYIGKEFKVSLISQCLDISRLATIEKLDYLVNSTGIFFDVLNKDDVYSFRSQAFLDATRFLIGYTDDGSNISTVAQSSRNYHALIAQAIKSLNSNNPDDSMAVAKHFFAAGSLYSSDAYDSNLSAAKLACKFHQFEDALTLLEKAKLSASSLGQSDKEVEKQIAIVLCEKSHIYGKEQSEAADLGIEILDGNISPDNEQLAVSVVRALYEARRYDEAIEMAEKLKHCDSIVTQTEGFHFHGLSISPQERDKSEERLSLLRKAYDLATQSKQTGLEAMVANSLAGALSGGKDDQRAEAKELYHKSLELKEKQEIKDVKGIAMTHGGLGFFSFFGKPQDMEAARFHFEKDLELATQINGELGMSKMNSMLSQIDLAENKIVSAVQRSIIVLNLDNNPFDTGKAIETLCVITKIKLPDNFNPMEVDICAYLEKILKALSKHKDSDLKNIASDIEALMKKICD
jgi:tetratricopeptide (TPR) repeat protein|tara:strand:- start:963 stop:4916 length:3954 start_codon:yes stop_codon:yes gene_type:complete